MQYLEGGPVMRDGDAALGEPEAAVAVADVAAALAYLHWQGVCHGDVKPENMLRGADGRVRLTDFSVSQACSPTPSLHLLPPADTPCLILCRCLAAMTTTMCRHRREGRWWWAPQAMPCRRRCRLRRLRAAAAAAWARGSATPPWAARPARRHTRRLSAPPAAPSAEKQQTSGAPLKASFMFSSGPASSLSARASVPGRWGCRCIPC